MTDHWQERLREAGYVVHPPPRSTTTDPYDWIVRPEGAHGGCARCTEWYAWDKAGLWVATDGFGVAMHDHPLFETPEAALAYAALQGWLA